MYICRICLDPNIARDMDELPLHTGDTNSFEEVIYFCLSIRVSHDLELYRKLCIKCFDSVIAFYKFKSVALKNNEYIQACYGKKEDGLDCVKVEKVIQECDDYDGHDNEMNYDPVGAADLRPLSTTLKKEDIKPLVTETGGIPRRCRKLKSRNTADRQDLPSVDAALQKCNVCDDEVSDLPTHLLTHDSVETTQSTITVPCLTCGNVFPTRQQMMRHLRIKHAPETKCTECAESVSCLTDHMRVSHDKSSPKASCGHCKLLAKTHCNQCSQCPKTFKKKHRLDAHVQRYHAERKELQCQYCSEKFRAYCSLHKHEATHTINQEVGQLLSEPKEVNTGDSALELDAVPTSTDATNIAKKMYKCAECGDEFASRTMMYRHREPKGKRQCDICLKFYGYASLSTHKRIVHQKESLPFGCSRCGRRFLQRSKLVDHERTHTKERPYSCTRCEKSFTQEISLKNHVQNVHEKQRTYICQHCCMGFFLKQNLEKHILRRHSSELPHECPECGMRFKIKDALKDHASKHTGARPHRCPLCSLAFRQKGGLRSHLRMHSSEQPYACRHCGARFKRADYRRNHERKAHADEFYDAEKKLRPI